MSEHLLDGTAPSVITMRDPSIGDASVKAKPGVGSGGGGAPVRARPGVGSGGGGAPLSKNVLN